MSSGHFLGAVGISMSVRAFDAERRAPHGDRSATSSDSRHVRIVAKFLKQVDPPA